MRPYLVDTHLLIWALLRSPQLSRRAATLIGDPSNDLFFSPVSIAEIAIKYRQGRADFPVEPETCRRALLENGYVEMPLTSLHAERIGALPPVHKDPFDRLLVAQALVEGVPLVTADTTLAAYPGQIVLV